MKSTWFASKKRYEIARLIAESDHASQHYQAFSAFLDAACGSLRQAVYKFTHGQMSDDIEAGVVRAQRSVRKPERLSHAFGALVDALAESPEDCLGKLMSELAINDVAWKGQCFSPTPLSRCMAEMAFAGMEPDGSRTLRLCEPACGGGSMLIAASEVLKEKGFFPWHYRWWATDIDRRCFQMTYIQSTLLHIPVGVIHGNTLTVEQWDSAWTLAAVMHPERRRSDDGPEEMASVVQEETIVFNQRTLF